MIPIPAPWLILGAGIAIAAAYGYGRHEGATTERTAWVAKINAERASAAEQARATEQRHQRAADESTKRQTAELAAVRSRLRIALDSLRDRPDRRPDLPAAAAADCTGGTGAGLSRPDAEFLAGEAARANEIRAGLAACYRHLDTALK